MPVSPLKHALEGLLSSRSLHLPPGEGRRLAPMATGDSTLDARIGGGFPRGEISQLQGPPSSGRTAIALSTLAQTTGEGRLAAWIDPADQLDPASAAAAGVDLSRLLWIRGRPGDPLKRCIAATSIVLGSGLFDLVVLDLAGTSERERDSLPGTTWARLHHLISGTPPSLLVLSLAPLARSASGLSLELQAPRVDWRGTSGPGRFLGRLSGLAQPMMNKRLGPAIAFERAAFD